MSRDTRTKIQKLRDMAERGATEGERETARAAIGRVKPGAAFENPPEPDPYKPGAYDGAADFWESLQSQAYRYWQENKDAERDRESRAEAMRDRAEWEARKKAEPYRNPAEADISRYYETLRRHSSSKSIFDQMWAQAFGKIVKP